MFKKLVSNLPYSPTLIGELGFYAKRLRKEEATRRLGLIFTALALVVQSLSVFSPPESANAANLSDLIHGGIHTKSQLLNAWDTNRQGYRELLEHAGISRENLVAAKDGYAYSRTNGQDNGWVNWSRISRGGNKYNESSFTVGNQNIYIRSLAAFDSGKFTRGNGSAYPSFVGKTNSGEDFIIMKGCANIAMKKRFTSDKPIKVCELNTRTVVTIRSSQYDKGKHSSNLADCQPKPIQVCDLATRTMIEIDERDFNQQKYSKNPEDCKPLPEPIANCSSLTLNKLSRTEVELKAAASVQNGATIKSYTYIIKDKSGKEIKRQTVNSGATSTSLRQTLDEGDYTAEVIVSTSLGERTAEVCKTNLKIEPIERCPLNPGLAINDPECQPCPGDPTIWVKDEDCAAKVIGSKVATNLTAGKPAEEVTAKASDRIEYTLTARNEGNDDATFTIEDNLSDVLEYGTLYDRGSGELNESTKVLSWSGVTLKPGEEQKRTYVVQLHNKISLRPQGTSDPTSYDCRMLNVYGNATEINVECPAPKVIEQIVPELPRTGAATNIIAGGLVVAVVAFLYARSRQLAKEVRLIRREAAAGTI